MAAGLKPVYLLTGSDRPKIDRAVRRLRARFLEGSVDELDAESASGEDAVRAASALGLFGGGERLVLVTGIERWKRADVDTVIAYVADPTPGAVLALTGDGSGLGALVEAIASAGEVLRFDLPTRRVGRRELVDYPAWVVGRFEQLGIRVGRDAADRLVALVGEDTLALDEEIVKIATWAAGEPVGVEEIERVATPSTEEGKASALVGAWGARDAGEVLRVCERDLLGEPEPFWIAGRIARHVATVRAAQHLLDRGTPLAEIQKRLELRFPPRREAAHAEAYSREELEAALVRLARLDYAIKGGSRLDPVLELERALLEVTGTGSRRL